MSEASINGKLVSVLHMDDDGWIDSKGSNDGTPSGGPVFSNTPPAPILGMYSGDFDIVDDFVSTGNTGLDKDIGGFHFLWAPSRAGNDGANWIPLIWGIQGSAVDRFVFIKRTNNALSLEINNAAPQPGLDVSGWAADSIHQIIGTWDNGTQKLYIDGVLVKTLSYPLPTSGRPNVFINGDSSLKGGGVLDEVAFFDNILTDGGVADGVTAGGEIAEVFNNGNYLVFNQIVAAAGGAIINGGMAGDHVINRGIIGV